MITASIVLYKSQIEEVKVILECATKSIIQIIFVVDNSPTDELRSLVEGYSKTHYIYGQGNVGYGQAHNIAFNMVFKSKSQFHVILNPDIYFADGVIESLYSFAKSYPCSGQIMPKVVYPDGRLQYLCKLLPTPIDLIGRRFIPIKRLVMKRNMRYEMHDSGYNKTMKVPNLSGCFMFCNVEALAKTKGFDENFFMYCEDLDLCRRIGIAGYDTLYYPEVVVVHAHKKESFQNMRMLKAHIVSAVRYFNKWGWFFDHYRTVVNKEIENQIYNKQN